MDAVVIATKNVRILSLHNPTMCCELLDLYFRPPCSLLAPLVMRPAKRLRMRLNQEEASQQLLDDGEASSSGSACPTVPGEAADVGAAGDDAINVPDDTPR